MLHAEHAGPALPHAQVKAGAAHAYLGDVAAAVEDFNAVLQASCLFVAPRPAGAAMPAAPLPARTRCRSRGVCMLKASAFQLRALGCPPHALPALAGACGRVCRPVHGRRQRAAGRGPAGQGAALLPVRSAERAGLARCCIVVSAHACLGLLSPASPAPLPFHAGRWQSTSKSAAPRCGRAWLPATARWTSRRRRCT